MGGKIYTKSVSVGGVDIRSNNQDPNGTLQGDMGSVCVSQDPIEPGIYQNMDGASQWDLLVPRQRLMIGIVRETLVTNGEDPNDVDTGLYATVFSTFASLPAVPANNPSYAIVWPLGQESWQIAWFIHGVWQLTGFPWRRPGIPLPSGGLSVITLSNSVGAGNSGWQYAMGEFYKGTAGSTGRNLIGVAIKLGATADGTAHTVTVRKGATSPTLPALSSFNTIVDTRVMTAEGDAWAFEAFAAPIPFGPNDWFHAQLWVGQGGQTFSIPGVRSSGDLNENFLTLEASGYILTTGTNPGTTPIPTISNTTTAYGIVSLISDGGPA